MSKVKLGDVCTIQSGGTPSRSKQEYWDGSIPWVKISDLNSKYLYSTDELISEKGLNNSSAKIFPKDSILFSIFATLGEVAILKIPAATNQAIAGLTINDDSELDLNYLYYFLLSLKTYVNGIGRGVAQNNINMSILKSIEIPVPFIGNQRKIAYNLDRVNCLIDLCNNTLEKLDTLVKSRFVEMFGDFESLVNIWEPKKISDVTINYDNTRKPIKDSDRKKIQGKYPYYGATDIVDYLNNYRIDGTFLLVSEDGKALEFRNRDIAFIAKGKIWVNNHAHVLQCNSLVNMIFLMYYINNRDISSWVTGIDQKKLNRENLDKMPVGVPPIELQNRFADFVAQIEKQKTTVKMSLEKLETLKKSLMQEYFG